MKFHHVGMVLRLVSVAEKLCRQRLKDDEPRPGGRFRPFSVLLLSRPGFR